MAHNAGELPTKGADGKWRWSDGTEVTPAEAEELKAQASGAAPTQGSNIDTAARGVGPLDWLLPKQISGDAAGSSLDTSLGDEDRLRTQGLLEQLQQQAATGGGAWEHTLADATKRAQATASAIGQAQANTGGDYASSLRNIGNAQSGAAQRAVGQGNILREQSKDSAQDLLGSLIPSMGGQDVQDAAASAAARQGLRETNAALVQGARKTIMDVGGGAGQALVAGASDGGEVPGVPKVFGDDQRNDTVPAMLSPGEIVVPRSQAGDPEAAADFARAVAMRKGAKGYDMGGDIDEKGNPTGTRTINWDELLHGTDPQGASIQNGGKLNDFNAVGDHAAAMDLAGMMASRAAGQGGTAPQLITNAADDTIAGAMQQVQQRTNAANTLSAAAAQQQGAGGEAAATAGNEQSHAERSLANFTTQQRANDMALSRAEQQAGWRNTEMNAGLNLQNQALVGRLLSGTAQGVAALRHAGFGADNGDDYSLESGDTPTDGFGEAQGPAQEEPEGDYPETDGDSQYAAHGGLIGDVDDDERSRVHRFLKQLGKKRAA